MSNSDTTRNDSVQEGDLAAVIELGRPAVLDIEEADLNVEPFAFKPVQLASLVDPKSLEKLDNLGGVEGLRGLGTSLRRGLSSDLLRNHGTTAPYGMQITPTSSVTIEDRQRVYGQNVLPQRPSKTLLRFVWLALQDKVIVSPMTPHSFLVSDVRMSSKISLSAATVISLAFGIFQDIATVHPEGEPPVDWVEVVAIIAAIFVVVVVGSLNDWQKEKQFKALNAKKDDRLVKVIRNGKERQIHVGQVVVGDVMLLEPGNVIPCDGIHLSGHNVLCDESTATGESDAIKKLSYLECITLRDRRLMELNADGPFGNGDGPSDLELLGHADCFIVNGSRVLDGVGSYVVTSVGTKSFNGRIMMGSSIALPCVKALDKAPSCSLVRPLGE